MGEKESHLRERSGRSCIPYSGLRLARSSGMSYVFPFSDLLSFVNSRLELPLADCSLFHGSWERLDCPCPCAWKLMASSRRSKANLDAMRELKLPDAFEE